MKKVLAFQWFESGDSARQNELFLTSLHNLQLDFDQVIVFQEGSTFPVQSEKVQAIDIDRRLRYCDFLELASKPEFAGALMCLSNTDILLDPRIPSLADEMTLDDFVCITRHEDDGTLAAGPHCTQDTWLLLGQPIHRGLATQSAIALGLPGCELRFAEMMYTHGYKVSNPCLDFVNIHKHKVSSAHRDTDRLYGAYLFTPPCHRVQIKDRSVTPRLVYLDRNATGTTLIR